MFDIITDSACDLTLDTAKQLQIEVVPFYVSLDGEHYRKEGKEIAVRDFYQFMVDNPSAYPKTSLASIEDFEQAFRAHAAAGRDVLCLVFTSKMSGCVGSARNVEGQAVMVVTVNGAEHPYEELKIGGEYVVEYDATGALVDFAPAPSADTPNAGGGR